MNSNRLKQYRLEKGYTLTQVALRLEMKCEDRLSHWERGSAVPSLQNALKLARLYEVSVHDLFPIL
ncbi:MAG: helix-turn-helix transcriptional regulator [Lacibacter sp.]|jgi:transcriptional regulator with XRE-family HTH domain